MAVATKDEEMETGTGEDDAKEMKHLRWD